MLLQEGDGEAVPVRRRARRGGAPAPAVFDPVEHYQRFYHARTAVQMKKEELAAIMADPKAAPDSDDEEDIEEWKVGLHLSRHYLPALMLVTAHLLVQSPDMLSEGGLHTGSPYGSRCFSQSIGRSTNSGRNGPCIYISGD